MSADNTLIFNPSDISVIDGQPRVLDLRLAEVLEFERPRVIRELIQRHEPALAEFGEVCRTARQTTSKGGRPTTEYHLNEEQAVFLCAKSETTKATAVTIEVVKTFVAFKNGTTQVKAHTRRKAPPMDQIVDALNNANITPRQLLQQQLENHARAIFAVLEDSLPIGLDRLEHVWLHNKNGKLTIGSTIFPHGEWRHGDLSAVLTPEYRWKIEDGKRSAARTAISNSKGK